MNKSWQYTVLSFKVDLILNRSSVTVVKLPSRGLRLRTYVLFMILFISSCATPPKFTKEELTSLNDGSVKVFDKGIGTSGDAPREDQDMYNDIVSSVNKNCKQYNYIKKEYPVEPLLFNRNALIRYVLDFKNNMKTKGFNFSLIEMRKSSIISSEGTLTLNRLVIGGEMFFCTDSFLESIDEKFLVDVPGEF